MQFIPLINTHSSWMQLRPFRRKSYSSSDSEFKSEYTDMCVQTWLAHLQFSLHRNVHKFAQKSKASSGAVRSFLFLRIVTFLGFLLYQSNKVICASMHYKQELLIANLAYFQWCQFNKKKKQTLKKTRLGEGHCVRL